MLLCSVMLSRIALAILAKQSAGFAFSVDRKLLLCSVTSPRIALAILVEQNAGFALFGLISYFVKSLMNTCLKECLRCPGLARYHRFLDGTLSLRCATSRYLMSLKYET